MKVLHICTKDSGGAAIAGIRLHKGLLGQGVNSKFLFQEKKTTEIPQSYYLDRDKKTFRSQLFDKLRFHKSIEQKNKEKLKGVAKNYDMFSFAESDIDITHLELYQEADLINLHWVPRFLDYPSFFRKCKKPIVWTLHDMNPFHGGFHYLLDQEKNSGTIKKIDRQIWAVKQDAYVHCASLTTVAPSKWMYQAVTSSVLLGNFPAHHIPNGIDTTIFKTHNQLFARDVFNLPEDKKILLFVSDSLSNERKGFDLLLQAISEIQDDALWLCTVGKANVETDQFSNISSLGNIADERLISLLYSACDAFVLPSREDNFPNVLLEATACGTPVIAFSIGGVPDIIQHEKNGLLAEDVSANSLQAAIEIFLSGKFQFSRDKIREQTSKDYTLEVQAEQYITLYNKILKHSS